MSQRWWRTHAVCARIDPDTFFPARHGPAGQAAAVRRAVALCSGCPVRADCLEYALTHDERFGVWGGMTSSERQRLRTS